MPTDRRCVLFDFTGTLFHIESAEQAVTAALGPEFARYAPDLERLGAINGSGTSPDLPADLRDVWEARDLSRDAHRAAYSGLSRRAGLTAEQAHLVYERGLSPDAWQPYPDTTAVLRTLRDERRPVALLSNIGWDPRPVLEHYGVLRYFDALVLSDERGVQKPDPRIFQLACDELGVSPREAVMVGDNPDTDGAATAIGCAFVQVEPLPERRAPDELLRAVELRAVARPDGGGPR